MWGVHPVNSGRDDTISAAGTMSLFQPTSEERDLLQKAVAKFAHDPSKSRLLSRLAVDNVEYQPGSEEWKQLQFCIEQYHLHVQTEVRRDPNKKATKLLFAKADALARKFHPNFS
jgi:hypothetical protein